ncbi:unnamed protein product [Prorocentrum cordatum]|uniref:Uncharacterized protein n=1 Tax=Prorocentrum cordatum TaxID=2364126 RepID=A0ABN9S6T5_9DINO|nr:unnamed protein product [Polarella glacialis]
MARIMGLRGGGAGGSETRPKVMSYLVAAIFDHCPARSLRVSVARELRALATSVDLLESGSLAEFSGVLMQRFKALGLSLGGVSWQAATWVRGLSSVSRARPATLPIPRDA